jgi:NAD(P)-dependent dehydrogenase (short-subunit alcohol dehydrogenase family)
MNAISHESIFVVSGGAKGITAQCVIRMAQQYRCTFVLLGRTKYDPNEPTWAEACQTEAELMLQIVANHQGSSERLSPAAVQQQVNRILSNRSITNTIAAVEQAGGHAEYLSVDITDADAVQQYLAPYIAQLPHITGLIHGAGVLADKLISKKSVEDFELVYATKIRGLRNLLQYIDPARLAYLVFFSSIAGFYGNVGQTDYALANAILDKAAHQLQRMYPNCRVLSLNWGPWDSGMVSTELRELFEEHQFRVISGELGAQALIEQLEAPHKSTQTVVGAPIGFASEHLNPILEMIRARRSLMGMAHDHMNAQLQRYRINRRLSLDVNPFLQDHIIHGSAVLPATCAYAWMVNLCEQIYPGLHCVSSENFTVLKGIVFDENLADNYVLHLHEQSKQRQPDEVVFEALIASTTTQGQERYHYRATITLREDPLPESRYARMDVRETHNVSLANYYQQGLLFHGPSFQGVQHLINQSSTHQTIRCQLPALAVEQQGQFAIQTVNPFVSDVCLQSALVWMQDTQQQIVLPLGVQRIEHYKLLEFDKPYLVSLEITDANPNQLRCNIIVHDEHGTIYQQMIGLEGAILPPEQAQADRR